jgi:3-methylcrotonyl-CoA carboxylase beta subunit
MACATVPKIMCDAEPRERRRAITRWPGRASIPVLRSRWPTARIGVMEGDSAVQAVHGPELAKLKAAGQAVPAELEARLAQTRADYERWLDAKYAAARGHVDALIDPADTRQILSLAFDAACFKSSHGALCRYSCSLLTKD